MLVSDKMAEDNFHLVVYEHDTLEIMCGYVGVPPEHPLYEIDYTQCIQGCPGEESSSEWKREQNLRDFPCIWKGHKYPANIFEVHGELTAASHAGVSDSVWKEKFWYFGFDCGHLWDIVPGLQVLIPPSPGATYKDATYAAAEMFKLHEQMKSFVLKRPMPGREQADDIYYEFRAEEQR